MQPRLLTIVGITIIVLVICCVWMTIRTRCAEKERSSRKNVPIKALPESRLSAPDDFTAEPLNEDDGFMLLRWENDPWTFKGAKQEGQDINTRDARFYLLSFYAQEGKSIYQLPVKFSPYVYNPKLISNLVGLKGPVAGVSVARTQGTGGGYMMSEESDILSLHHHERHMSHAPSMTATPVGASSVTGAEEKHVACPVAETKIDAPVLHCFDYFKFEKEGSFHVETCGPIANKAATETGGKATGKKVGNSAKSTRLFLQWFPVDRVDHYVVYGRSGSAEVSQNAYEKKWKVPASSYYIETEELKGDVAWSAIVTAVDAKGTESTPSAVYKTY